MPPNICFVHPASHKMPPYWNLLHILFKVSIFKGKKISFQYIPLSLNNINSASKFSTWCTCTLYSSCAMCVCCTLIYEINWYRTSLLLSHSVDRIHKYLSVITSFYIISYQLNTNYKLTNSFPDILSMIMPQFNQSAHNQCFQFYRLNETAAIDQSIWFDLMRISFIELVSTNYHDPHLQHIIIHKNTTKLKILLRTDKICNIQC